MSGSLTVLHVLEAVGHGTGRHLHDLVRNLPELEHHAVLPRRPTPRGEGDTDRLATSLTKEGATVHLVPMRRSPMHPDLLRAVRDVRRLVRDVRPQLVHGHATVGGFVTRLACRGTGVPSVYTPNGIHPRRLVRTAERALRPLTTLLIAVSPSEADLAVRTRIIPADRVVVVRNGIDLSPPEASELDLREACSIDREHRIVGFIGRLARQKGPDVLVEAAASLPPDVHVVLVGGGEWTERVSALVERARLAERIHLIGHVESAARLIEQFDVVALPSRWEGGPYVPLEAIRSRVPVTATDVVGVRDIVVDQVTGLLVPVDAPRLLARAIMRLLDDASLRARVVVAAERLLRDKHDVEQMAAQTAAAYRRVVTPSDAFR